MIRLLPHSEVVRGLWLVIQDIDERYDKKQLLDEESEILEIRRAACKIAKDWLATRTEWSEMKIEEF